MKSLLAIAALAIALSGCSVLATNDIDRAIGMATAAGDTAGLACLQAQKPAFSAEPIGFFTVIEQGRLVTNAMAKCAGIVPSVPVKP